MRVYMYHITDTSFDYANVIIAYQNSMNGSIKVVILRFLKMRKVKWRDVIMCT